MLKQLRRIAEVIVLTLAVFLAPLMIGIGVQNLLAFLGLAVAASNMLGFSIGALTFIFVVTSIVSRWI